MWVRSGGSADFQASLLGPSMKSFNGVLQSSFFPGRMATQRLLALSGRSWPVISPSQRAPSCFPQWLLLASSFDTCEPSDPHPHPQGAISSSPPPNPWSVLRAESSQQGHL